MAADIAIKAVVQKVVPKGEHGPFAVATSKEEEIEGSITFSLEPTVWQESEWPEEGTLVLLGRIRKKRAGWRAKTGRFFRPSDEQEERRNEMKDQYRRISREEINAAAGSDPQRAILMVLANSSLDEAADKASGKKSHEPQFHKAGWSIALETPCGVVGLCSYWLKNGFFLGYPKRTSFHIRRLKDVWAIRVAEKFCREHPDQVWFPSGEKGLDAATAKQFLTGFPEDELLALLKSAGMHYSDEFHFGDAMNIPDQLIMDTLGVELAQPVLQVSACAVGKEDYQGEHKDPDKPLVRNEAGQVVAYQDRGPRLWAKFYGPRVAGNKGRVWVDHSDFDSNAHHFDVVESDLRHGLRDVYYGHDFSRSIRTYEFSFWNEYAPDGPTSEPEVIQSYRDKFLALVCEIARQPGSVWAVNINYGFVFVPEQLSQLGYTNIQWLKGRAGVREGRGKEVVRAEKETSAGKEVVVLRSGNSLVPWSTIRRVPCSSELNTEQLLALLTF